MHKSSCILTRKHSGRFKRTDTWTTGVAFKTILLLPVTAAVLALERARHTHGLASHFMPDAKCQVCKFFLNGCYNTDPDIT